MTDVIGLTVFGIRDCVSAGGVIRHNGQFRPAQALLPESASGRVRTGMRAKKDRTHTGLHWPIEAQISLGSPVRRVPIVCVWRALVEAGDRSTRWKIGKGVSFPLAKIIATHVADFIKDAVENFKDTQPVMAIPDHLDEFGQESLLSELAARGVGNIVLLWRPVAAALSWLEKVQDDFDRERMHPDDHIHIIYLGADTIELTTLRLRSRSHDGLFYILPLRDRPKNITDFTGFDWAGRLIENVFPNVDPSGFWQLFNIFPDVWEAIAGRSLEIDRPPRTLSSEGSWSLWQAPKNLHEQAGVVSVGHCDKLRRILKTSYELNPVIKDVRNESVNTYLQNQLSQMAERFPDGSLRGIIITGPLASPGVPDWLRANFGVLEQRGLMVSENLSIAAINRPWLCTQSDDLVAEGAEIFGRRLNAGIPAYLDTMPQVYILAQEKSRYTWVPLLDAQEVLGGHEHKDRISGKFMLGKGIKKIDAYLYKGPYSEAEKIMEEASNQNLIPHHGIPPCMARWIRLLVRRMGSLDRVLNNHFFRRSDLCAAYGKAFANSIYFNEAVEEKNREGRLQNVIPLNQSSFRLSRINFPSASSQDVKLDIEVRMRPASGLARVEIIPEKPDFLNGRKVRLEYGKMRPPEQLPRFTRGWPLVHEIVVDPDDKNLLRYEYLVAQLEQAHPGNPSYLGLINSIRDKVIKGKTLNTIAGYDFFLDSIDQNGCACSTAGNEIISRISKKFEKDFDYYFSKKDFISLNKIFSRAAWLYCAIPEKIISYIKSVLDKDYNCQEWLYAVDSAGRCVCGSKAYRHLFLMVARRINRPPLNRPRFPIQSARAIWRILMLREDGEKGLNTDLARLFSKSALKALKEEENKEKFSQRYFQFIRLLLYLLRFRKDEPECFDPTKTSTLEAFDLAVESMKNAKKFFQRQRNYNKSERIKRIVDGFEQYLYYEGSDDLLILLDEEAGGLE